MNFIRFNAVHGRNIDNKIINKYVRYSCNIFCPDSVIGCGLSHILLSNYFLNNDLNEFALILEDDAIPLYKNTKEQIINCVKKMNGVNWDIIKLYCQGICGYDDKTIKIPFRYFNGSTAAYLLSKNGAKKLSKFKLMTHIDIQQNIQHLEIYKSEYPLFKANFNNSSTSTRNNLIEWIFNLKIGKYNPPVYFFLEQKICRLPIINIKISVYHIIILIIILMIILFYKKIIRVTTYNT